MVLLVQCILEEYIRLSNKTQEGRKVKKLRVKLGINYAPETRRSLARLTQKKSNFSNYGERAFVSEDIVACVGWKPSTTRNTIGRANREAADAPCLFKFTGYLNLVSRSDPN